LVVFDHQDVSAEVVRAHGGLLAVEGSKGATNRRMRRWRRAGSSRKGRRLTARPAPPRVGGRRIKDVKTWASRRRGRITRHLHHAAHLRALHADDGGRAGGSDGRAARAGWITPRVLLSYC